MMMGFWILLAVGVLAALYAARRFLGDCLVALDRIERRQPVAESADTPDTSSPPATVAEPVPAPTEGQRGNRNGNQDLGGLDGRGCA